MLFHVLPSVLANYVQIIGKISGKNAKYLDFLPSGWDWLEYGSKQSFGSILTISSSGHTVGTVGFKMLNADWLMTSLQYLNLN